MKEKERRTRYSDHEGISLAPGTRESFTTRARVANIDEASQFAYVIRPSALSRMEVSSKKLDDSDILTSISR